LNGSFLGIARFFQKATANLLLLLKPKSLFAKIKHDFFNGFDFFFNLNNRG